jgi:N-acetylmuramoyl-L-alanine amidase
VLPLLLLVLNTGPVIVIDPGHGGTQGGATGSAGLVEKELCLNIAKKLKTQLEKELKATVVLTREKDALVHLSDRVDLANAKKPDLFISIHANSMPTEKQRRVNQGIETYFLSASASGEDAKKVAARENAETGMQPKGNAGDTLSFILADLQKSETHSDSSRLAYAVHESLIAETGAQDRGVQQAPFYVLMGLEAPAVLVEVGFVSHPEEGKQLNDAEYQSKLARAITAGARQFLEQIETRDGKKTE